MTSLFRRLLPPEEWQKTVVIALGIIVGLGIYIASIANVTSYLTDDPQACVNCHVMTPQYITWKNSAHANVATCNDCHVPHDNFVKSYAFKARDGLYHSWIYTLRTEPQAIVMHELGRQVVQQNCIRCHVAQVTDVKADAWVTTHREGRLERTCWECHRHTPHGRVRSLAAVGQHLEPLPVHEQRALYVPDWYYHETQRGRNHE